MYVNVFFNVRNPVHSRVNCPVQGPGFIPTPVIGQAYEF